LPCRSSNRAKRKKVTMHLLQRRKGLAKRKGGTKEKCETERRGRRSEVFCFKKGREKGGERESGRAA